MVPDCMDGLATQGRPPVLGRNILPGGAGLGHSGPTPFIPQSGTRIRSPLPRSCRQTPSPLRGEAGADIGGSRRKRRMPPDRKACPPARQRGDVRARTGQNGRDSGTGRQQSAPNADRQPPKGRQVKKTRGDGAACRRSPKTSRRGISRNRREKPFRRGTRRPFIATRKRPDRIPALHVAREERIENAGDWPHQRHRYAYPRE